MWPLDAFLDYQAAFDAHWGQAYFAANIHIPAIAIGALHVVYWWH